MLHSVDLKVWNIELASMGAFILGCVMLINYNTLKNPYEKYIHWWQHILGIYCFIYVVIDLFPSKIAAPLKGIFLLAYVVTMQIRYKQLKNPENR